MSNNQRTLKIEPFPVLEWDGNFWQGTVVLPAWQGFQERMGSYGSLSSAGASEGSVRLNIEVSDEGQPPTPAQIKAFQYLLEHQEQMRDAILQAILKEYPAWQESYGYDEEEAQQFMPDIERPQQLETLMGLHSIHIQDVTRDDIAYIGFECGCTWDDEHGFGAMMHQMRVVEIGGADTSFLSWIAEQDAGIIRPDSQLPATPSSEAMDDSQLPLF